MKSITLLQAANSECTNKDFIIRMCKCVKDRLSELELRSAFYTSESNEEKLGEWEEIADVADEIIDKPIDESQKVELAEIDGSLILQLNTVINKKFEDYIAANSENIKVLTPNSLQAKIKKLING